MSIFAGTDGALDDVPAREVQRFEKEFLEFVKAQRPQLRAALDKEKKMTDAIVADLRAALKDFKASFRYAGKPEAGAPVAAAAKS
jgi:F-type H+-transporting ATPase subunit alpha